MLCTKICSTLNQLRKFVSMLSFTILLTLQSNVFAVEIKNIYQGKANIENQGQRNEAINNALQGVLSKLLSNQARSNTQAIDAILVDAPQYVQQYRFENPNRSETTKNENSSQLLIVDFNPFALNTALKSHGFQTWGTDRPEVLLWLVVEDNRKRQVFAADTMPKLETAIGNAVESKGLTLLFPLMDLTDRRQLSVNDIWLGFDDRIRQASERYGVDHILVGRLSRKTTNKWTVDWKFFQQKKIDEWQAKSVGRDQAIQIGIDGVFERMIPAYVSKELNIVASGIEIKISGITNLSDAQQVENHLKSLSTVQTVEWLTIQPKFVIFRLTLNGNEEQLQQLLATDEKLAPALFGEESGVLDYQFVP